MSKVEQAAKVLVETMGEDDVVALAQTLDAQRVKRTAEFRRAQRAGKYEDMWAAYRARHATEEALDAVIGAALAPPTPRPAA